MSFESIFKEFILIHFICNISSIKISSIEIIDKNGDKIIFI